MKGRIAEMNTKASVRKESYVISMTLVAIATSLLCIFAPMSLPISIIPISLTNFVIYFNVYMLGCKKGVSSYLLYMLLGMVGLPVFSGFSGGIGKVAGPTGGYLIGFIFAAIIIGIFVDRFNGKRIMFITGMGIGLIVTYVFGTAWLAIQIKISFKAALAIGVLPFVIGDILKIIVVALVAPKIKNQVSVLNITKK